MNEDERISGALQENLLTLLVFGDSVCRTIRAAITPKLFESAVYREVASHAIDFIDQFGESPKDHIADSLEDILKGEDRRKASSFQRLLDNIYAARDTTNVDYVLGQLNRFVRQQNIKTSIVKAVEAIEAGRVDDAEVELQRGLSTQVVSFEKGITLGNPEESLTFLDHQDPVLLTGIEELDRRGIGLVKKEQLALMAPAGKGKTWGMIHLGKWALLQRQTVVHITMEMSEQRCAQRYIQSFLSISTRESRILMPTMDKDSNGAMSEVYYETITRPTLLDDGIRGKLASRITREFRRRPKLIIKAFPTGSLTIPQLDAYLDGLERHYKIVPNVVILDYPDLMAVDAANLRVSVGDLVKQLRGQAVRRNYAQLIATQSNRTGAEAKLVEATHAAEDYSKIATADTVLTYSQTKAEHRMGLARLFGAKVRNEEGGWIALLTQAYSLGQFALDSASLGSGDYWEYLKSGSHGDDS